MTQIYNDYKEALGLLNSFFKNAQQPQDIELKSPNVIVEPAEPLINSAIQILKRYNPNYFVGVRKIVVRTEPHYGHVSSGPGEDPSVIYINLNKIKQDAGGKTSGPEAIAVTIATIAHERGHVTSYDPKQGFVGGEPVAQQEEGKIIQWIKSNLGSLKDLLK